MLAAILTILALVYPTQSDEKPLIKRIQQQIVAISAYDQAGQLKGRGFGVFVSDSGDIVTSERLINGAARVEIRTSDGRVFGLTRLIAKDSPANLLVFHSDMPPGAAVPIKIARACPAIGEQVGTVMTGSGLDPTITMGAVKSQRPDMTWRVFDVPEALPRDSVGDPVFNLKGEFVGLVDSSIDQPAMFTVRGGEELVRSVDEMLSYRDADSTQAARIGGSDGMPISTMGIHRVGDVPPARVVKRVGPDYPVSAKGLNITGVVILRVAIDKAGNVVNAIVADERFVKPLEIPEARVKQLIPEFERAAISAVRRWKFAPVKFQGPGNTTSIVTFTFAQGR